jgi:hypothetical protein
MKTYFNNNYFNDKEISKIVYDREPLESPGNLQEVIKIIYKKWYHLNEKVVLDSKGEAENMVKYLLGVMNKNSSLSNFNEPYSTTFK